MVSVMKTMYNDEDLANQLKEYFKTDSVALQSVSISANTGNRRLTFTCSGTVLPSKEKEASPAKPDSSLVALELTKALIASVGASSLANPADTIPGLYEAILARLDK